MNRLFILLSIIIAIPSVKGQTVLTISGNGFRDGDSLVMRTVDRNHPGTSGRNAVWDFSNAEMGRVHTLHHRLFGDKFSTSEGCTLWRTVIHEDTLLLTGFENRHTLMEYDEPLPLLRYPFSFGDSVMGCFQGIGKWCDRTFMRVWGYGITRADAMGTLILPSCDTLRNVLRVHSVRRTWHFDYDSIHTWSILREVVRQEEMGGIVPNASKAVPVITDTYAWYAPGWRYPVFRMDASTDGMANKTFAVMYPPEVQIGLDYDMENDLLRQRMSISGGDGLSGYGTEESTKAMTAQTTSYDASTGTVTITFSLSRPASVHMLLSDVAGVAWRSTEQSYDNGGTFSLQFDCSGLPHGQYALRIMCGSDVVVEKFNVR